MEPPSIGIAGKFFDSATRFYKSGGKSGGILQRGNTLLASRNGSET